MANVALTSCCGLMELVAISGEDSPRDVLRKVGPSMLSYGEIVNGYPSIKRFVFARLRPFALFTGVTHSDGYPLATNQYGDNLATFIRDNSLGELIVTSEGMNWTKNWLKVWVWKPDYPNLMQWLVYEKVWGS